MLSINLFPISIRAWKRDTLEVDFSKSRFERASRGCYGWAASPLVYYVRTYVIRSVKNDGAVQRRK